MHLSLGPPCCRTSTCGLADVDVESLVSSVPVAVSSSVPTPVASPLQSSPPLSTSTPVPASCSVSSVSSRTRPVPVWSRPAPLSRPFRSAALPSCPVAPPPRLVPSPLLLPHPPLFPVVCFVLVAVPVLLSSPFGLVLSFLPLLR